MNVKSRKKQKGEMPVGQVLILALIVIPLVIALIAGGTYAKKKLGESATALSGDADNTTNEAVTFD